MDSIAKNPQNSVANSLQNTIKNIIRTKKSNVVLSADLTTSQEIIDLADLLGPKLLAIKLHSDIICDNNNKNHDNHDNIDFINQLVALSQKHNFLIIEDRKFCDIGNTVKLQSSFITQYANLITVHSISGNGILDGLRENCVNNCCGILLIAQMSSNNNLITQDYTNATVQMAKNNSDIVVGFIAQEYLANDFIHFTPGVSLPITSDNLGQQYNSPEYLISQKNVDCLIVGRGLYLAKEPEKEIDKYIYTKDDYLRNLLEDNRIIQHGSFTLKSGKKSNIYFDFRKTVSHPNILAHVGERMYELIDDHIIKDKIVICGVPMGAIPLATTISSLFSVPLIMVRSERKEHGLSNLIEGDIAVYQDKECILIEDVVTTGNSVLEIAEKMTKEGIKIRQILVVLDREEGGIKRIADKGYNVRSLYTLNELTKTTK